MTQNDPNRGTTTYKDPITGETPVGGASGHLTGAPSGGKWSTAARWLIMGMVALFVVFVLVWLVN